MPDPVDDPLTKVYRVSYEVQRSWGAWERETLDYHRLSYAIEGYKCMRSLADSSDTSPMVRNVQRHF